MGENYINIHPAAFVHTGTLLGMCSPDDDRQYLATPGENKREIKYPLLKLTTSFFRQTIGGRGTLCWQGVDVEARPFSIKNAWPSKDHNLERDHELTKEVKALPGFEQMVAWEDTGLATSDLLRRFDEEKLSTFLDSQNRIHCRITMEYGKTVDHFESREEFLHAFRDAVAGHRILWEAGILHRDVSINNVLIGKPNAEAGNRGVLIDWDMATRLDQTETLASVDLRTGTRAFQSISVLSSVNDTTGQALTHDYLDDLESFFYLFCWISLGYDGPNQPILNPRRPRVLRKWTQYDALAAANSKTTMMFVLDDDVTDYFGAVFQKLLLALHAFCLPHIIQKRKQRKDGTIPRKHLLDLTEPAKADYVTVSSFIDQAIVDLESEPSNAQCTTPTPVNRTELPY